MREEILETVIRPINFGAFTPDNDQGRKISTKVYILTILSIVNEASRPVILREKRSTGLEGSRDDSEEPRDIRKNLGIMTSPSSIDNLLQDLVKKGYIKKEASRPVYYKIREPGEALLTIYRRIIVYRRRKIMYNSLSRVHSSDLLCEVIENSEDLNNTKGEIPDEIRPKVLKLHREKDENILNRLKEYKETPQKEVVQFLLDFFDKFSDYRERERKRYWNFLSVKEVVDNLVYNVDALKAFNKEEWDDLDWLISEEIPLSDVKVNLPGSGALEISSERFKKLIDPDSEETEKVLKDIKDEIAEKGEKPSLEDKF